MSTRLTHVILPDNYSQLSGFQKSTTEPAARKINIASWAWTAVRERPAVSGYLVLVPDLGRDHWMNAPVVANLDAVIDQRIASGEVDPKRVHLIGTSMGGYSSLLYAIRRPGKVKSICVIFPPSNLVTWIAEVPKYAEPTADDFLARYSPSLEIKALGAIPLDLLHSEADDTIPVSQSRALAEAVRQAGGSIIYREVPGGHVDEIVGDYQEEIGDFLVGDEAGFDQIR